MTGEVSFNETWQAAGHHEMVGIRWIFSGFNRSDGGGNLMIFVKLRKGNWIFIP